MAVFTVWTLDVWGNEDDGFDVNDRCKVGTVEIDLDDNMSDREIMEELVSAGYLKPGSEDHGDVDGDTDSALYIGDAKTARPWLQLERQDEA